MMEESRERLSRFGPKATVAAADLGSVDWRGGVESPFDAVGFGIRGFEMYVPASFRMSDASELYSFMRTHSFAVLVTHGEGGMTATHLPLLLDADAGPRGTLIGHMARANPQWRDVAGDALVIFSGPHAYVSPTWYETPGTVPTWNYATVHAYGALQLVEGRDELHDILTRTTSVYERRMPEPWSYDVDDPDIDKMLRAIVGFRIEITRLEGKMKLNQNHPRSVAGR
ncbi:FMN-binding negative transcriptional regulator [Planctomyces sp. SH-PL62]|uniref:FMN-binding negative transcriptional regulator n=1 Tax=Planctomyces sp. SH-PL62 TaxID=1636152 RepID=UPI00078C7A12|nr:FMN-binding negative transcriptional regulator [Planctomyces sp. SH-PL62]AMV40912.1 Protease synthase and sporulation protein PAI 2 [Planctomyces sp. SH-PL62]